jgi:hypothetical protein
VRQFQREFSDVCASQPCAPWRADDIQLHNSSPVHAVSHILAVIRSTHFALLSLHAACGLPTLCDLCCIPTAYFKLTAKKTGAHVIGEAELGLGRPGALCPTSVTSRVANHLQHTSSSLPLTTAGRRIFITSNTVHYLLSHNTHLIVQASARRSRL